MLRSANGVQQEFRNAVRGTFSSMKRPPLDHPLPAPIIASAGREEAEQLGATAILLPEDCGGIPDAPGEFVMFHAECGRALLSLPLLSCTLAGVALDRFAPDAVRAERVGALVRGERIGTICGLAPSGRPRLAADGVLAGRAAAVIDLPQADFLLLVANSGDADGGCVLIDLPVDRLAGRQACCRLIDGSAAADIDLEGIRPTSEMILARGAEVAELAMQLRRLTCLARAADAIGGIERMIELTADYMQVRQQFGQPIAKFQALQHQLADGVADFELCRALLDAAVDEYLEQGEAGTAAETLGAFVPGRAIAIGERMIQIHGGIGITEEYEIGHHYRRLLVHEALLKPLCPAPSAIVRGYRDELEVAG